MGTKRPIDEIYTYEELLEVKSKYLYVVLDCYGKPCPPCEAMIPFLEMYQEMYPKVKFVKCNAYKSNLSDHIDIPKIPYFILYNNDKEFTTVTGKQEGLLQNKIMAMISDDK